MTRLTFNALLAGLLLASAALVQAQGGGVTFERLQNAAAEPHNWLTYSGGYHSNRHTALDQITTANVDELEMRWVFQAQSLQVFQTTPLVVDGVMYLTEAPNTVVGARREARAGVLALRIHAGAGVAPLLRPGEPGGRHSGRHALHGTIDAQLIAIDAVTGKPLWKTAVGDPEDGHALTLAPLVVKDKVVVGIAGGEFGIRGFISAYDAATGEEAWKFYTIPGPGEPGHETWENDAWRTGGAPAWLTGSYDPLTDLIYWGTGNPGPDWNPAQRPGDNLYSASVVALDPDTGELAWHFQFTPNDPYDYDSVQVPVLVDYPAQDGSTLPLMFWANRNGFFYVLDRTTGRFHQRPAVRVPQLGRGARRCRTPHHDAAAAGRHDVSRRPGRHELVLAVLQPIDAPVLPLGLGWERLAFHAAGGGI